MRILLALAMVAAASLGNAAPLRAQTLIGTWQSPLVNQRGVLKIAKAQDGVLRGELFNLGKEFSGGAPGGKPISKIDVQVRHVHFEVDDDGTKFDGELSADGNILTGTATSDGRSVPIKFERATDKTAWAIDPSSHKVMFVPVDKDVRLEVLDWGGSGPPLIFLAGLGNTAHVFDDFAPLFTGKHHVYGITRRGFGLSGRPTPTPENYDADRLGDDVLAVIGALKLDRPVIVGHSLAGEELSSISTRHPEKVSGLIYLDASYEYAFYSPKATNTARARAVNFSTMRRDLLQTPWASPSKAKVLIREMEAMLPLLQKDLQTLDEQEQGLPDPPRPTQYKLRDQIQENILSGLRMYPAVKTPVLAIVASPHACTGNCDTPQYKTEEADVAAQADAFQAGTPQARIVRIPNAEHYVFLSNGAAVVREMNAFMDGLH